MALTDYRDLAKLRAAKADAMAAVSGARGEDDLRAVVGKLAGEVIDVREMFAEGLGAMSSVVRAQQELPARVGTIEQIVAKMQTRGTGVVPGAHFGGPTIAAAVMEQLQGDQAEGFKDLQGGNRTSVRLNLKGTSLRAALTHTGHGGSSSDGGTFPGEPDRRGVTGPVSRRLRLLDVLPSRATTRDSVEFVQLGVTGDAAEQVNEGDQKAEIDFGGELKEARIATFAAWTAASKQVLSDEAQLQAEVDRVLRFKVLGKLEHALINGDGSDSRIDGLLNQATTLVPAIGTSPADIIGEALTHQLNSGYTPGLLILNPFDFFRIQITRTLTEEQYLFSKPTEPLAPSLWNTPIVTTPSMPEGKALTIDTSFVTVLDRESPSVMLSNSHADFFTRNLVAVLGELRAGLEIRDVGAVLKMDLAAST